MEYNNENLTSTKLVSINLSDDRQYLLLTEKKIISLKVIDLLAHEDERVRQAYHISTIFDKYIDHTRRIELVDALRDLLSRRMIALELDNQGETVINILRNKGQASLLRLVIGFMTPQKYRTLSQSGPFNDLKHLLLLRMRHLGLPISVNSLSVTLSRAINSPVKTNRDDMS